MFKTNITHIFLLLLVASFSPSIYATEYTLDFDSGDFSSFGLSASFAYYYGDGRQAYIAQYESSPGNITNAVYQENGFLHGAVYTTADYNNLIQALTDNLIAQGLAQEQIDNYLNSEDFANSIFLSTAHVHGSSAPEWGSRFSRMHADAGGAFIRKADGGVFDLNSWDFAELNTIEATEQATEAYIVIQGSLNGVKQFTLDIFDTTPLGTFDFLTATDGASANLDLVEYWFSSRGKSAVPDFSHADILVSIDNIVVTSVPIPAAFCLFFSGLIGLASFSKNTQSTTY